MNGIKKIGLPATIKSYKAIKLRAEIKFRLFPTLEIENM